MNKLLGILCLMFVSLFYGQEMRDKTFFKLKKSIVYVDNSIATHFTMKFPGDTISSTGVENGYFIGDELIQVLKYKYDPNSYSNREEKSKEVDLLKYYMDYEVDYLQNELFNKSINVKNELFLNNSNKKFHLWWYKIPQINLDDEDTSEITNKTEHYYYLSCVTNDYVSVISFLSFEGQNVEEKITKIKEIANTINVFGGPIDLNGTYAKMQTEEEGKTLEFVNEKVGFEIDLPVWVNILESDLEKNWVITMPDIDNVKNAVSIEWFDKVDYKSIKSFNKKHILGKKIGDKINGGTLLLRKELLTPIDCDGIAQKLQIMFGNSLYQCQYVTYVTEGYYLLFKFVATQKTYDLNVKRFEELLSKLKIL